MHPIWIHMDLQLMVTEIKVCENWSLFLINGSSFNPRMNWKLIYKYHVKLAQAIDCLYPDDFLTKAQIFQLVWYWKWHTEVVFNLVL